MKKVMSGFMVMMASMAYSTVSAQMGNDAMMHSHGGSQKMGDSAAAEPSPFMEKIYVDGYEVTFHVMDAASEMQHGGEQNLMVMVQKNQKVIGDLIVNSKIVAPNKTESSKPMMGMEPWYMAGYDLSSKGPYQLMVLFKTEDGQKHFAGVHYDAK